MRAVLKSDEELIASVRAGDLDAYGELFARHRKSARAAARGFLHRGASIDDPVADAFARVLAAIQSGHGPHVAFRPYLLTAVRRACIDRGRASQREIPVEGFADHELQIDPTDSREIELERSLAARAYAQLPERWRAVLWYSEIEQMRPAKFGPLMGLTPNAAAALALRARDGLRDAYVQAHLEIDSVPNCQPTVDALGQYLRGSLAKRERARVDEHLNDCGRCSALYIELRDVAGGVRATVGVLVLGAAGVKVASSAAAWLGHIPKPTPKTMALSGAGTSLIVAVALVAAQTSPTQRAGARRGAAVITQPSHRTASSPTPTKSPTTTSQPTSSVAPNTTTASGSPAPSSTAPPTASSTSHQQVAAPISVDLKVKTALVGSLVVGHSAVVAVDAIGDAVNDAHDVVMHIDIPTGPWLMVTVDGNGWACTNSSRHADCNRSVLSRLGTATVLVRTSSPKLATQVSVTTAITSAEHENSAANNGSADRFTASNYGFAPRYVAQAHGGIVAVGNSMTSCDPTLSGCAAALDRVGPVSLFANDAWNMHLIDNDADPTTFNSSSATLQIPGHADVAFAGLYWGADVKNGAGGKHASMAQAARVLFASTGSAYSPVVASKLSRTGSRYQGFADVTDLVRQGGSGTYTVANQQVATGKGAYGGWSLVVVVSDPGLPMRTLAVLDGFEFTTPNRSPHVSISAGSQSTPQHERVQYVLYDGDAGVGGDVASINAAGGASGIKIGDVANSSLGSFAIGLGSSGNGFGFDIDTVDTLLAAGAPTSDVRFTTSGDIFGIGVVAMTIDLG